MHDTQPSTGGIRAKYSAGNFRGVRKGSICQDGQICGGTGNSYFIRNQDNKRVGRTNLDWLSHKFKTHEVTGAIPPMIEIMGILAPRYDYCSGSNYISIISFSCNYIRK